VAVQWVVKVGGSFAGSDLLPRWLEALAAAHVVIVPGGGPFADAVRNAQHRWRFDDLTAHRMAIYGMVQFGLMLGGLCPALRMASDREALANIVAAGESVVWLPDESTLSGEDLAASWDVTSDSLAAWLANGMRARRLLLVKSGVLPNGAACAAQLTAAGLIDRAFPRMIDQATHETWLCGPDDWRHLQAGLSDPQAFFTPVIPG